MRCFQSPMAVDTYIIVNWLTYPLSWHFSFMSTGSRDIYKTDVSLSWLYFETKQSTCILGKHLARESSAKTQYSGPIYSLLMWMESKWDQTSCLSYIVRKENMDSWVAHMSTCMWKSFECKGHQMWRQWFKRELVCMHVCRCEWPCSQWISWAITQSSGLWLTHKGRGHLL